MASLLTRVYWTRNRLEILIPWLTPLLLSLGIAFWDISDACMAFLVFSLIARIIAVKRSPFWKMGKEDFEERLKEQEITLENGIRLVSREIRKIKLWILTSFFLSVATLVGGLHVLRLFFTPAAALDRDLIGVGAWAFLVLSFQTFSKTYLIAKDSPLNGFPFFRSRSGGCRISNDSSTGIAASSFRDVYGSYGTTNIASPFHILNRNR